MRLLKLGCFLDHCHRQVKNFFLGDFFFLWKKPKMKMLEVWKYYFLFWIRTYLCNAISFYGKAWSREVF